MKNPCSNLFEIKQQRPAAASSIVKLRTKREKRAHCPYMLYLIAQSDRFALLLIGLVFDNSFRHSSSTLVNH